MSSPSKDQSPSLPSPRGYSDFFASGIRAVTNRARRASFTRRSVDVVQTSSSYWTDRHPEAHNGHSRRRHTSLVDFDLAHDKAKKRRSALIALSARLFERAPSSSPEESVKTSTASSSSGRSSKLSGSFQIIDSIDECSEALECESKSKLDLKSSASLQPREPHSVPPDVTSHTITFPSELISSRIARRESFLSLDSSASSLSSIMLPPLPEHPGSIHSPPNSRRSSTQLISMAHPEKPISSWITEEDSPIDQDLPLIREGDLKGEWDAPANLDWRQFHTDILTDDAE